MEPLLRARWFDGLSSQAQPVLVGLAPGPRGPALHLHPLTASGAAPRVFAHGEIGWPEAWNPRRAQRTVVVDLRSGGSLEIDNGAQWHAALEAAGGRPGLAQRMQTHWRVFAAVLVVAVLGLWAFYRWGTPWAAAQLAQHVPLGWEQQLSADAMQELDASYLKPSKLAPERQAELRAAFDSLVQQMGPEFARYPGYAPTMTLAFRSGMGANAFALPGGAMVVTDGLVEAARKRGLGDDALVGVLAHEMGHVVHRHTTRLVVEQGVLNVGLGLAMGDVSSIVATGSTLLTGLAYQRNHEAEADCFAVALMRKAQRPLAPMADLLLAIDGPEDEKESKKGKDDKPKATPPSSSSSALANLLSSHPATAERAQRMKSGQLQGCTAPR
ncbi:M48 family metallopeptidase [Variovorax fucosicus]|uniref:M48 family metallopeptidase n=1 Tax=Variovorax fucosicus TaxID=3053517 RepID=UPI002577429D|nr:M48 family metallopeptidase [Variovorax sp. J22G47]MDM0055892.1 M48 family metallopeptidase [Variovorax sp. J22G47]